MKKIQKFLGLFEEKVLEPREKMEVEAIKSQYDIYGCNTRILKWEIWDMLQTSSTYLEFKGKLIKYMTKRFRRKWAGSDNLALDYSTWKWLIEIRNKEITFDEAVLNSYDKASGYIGTFRGLDCYVKKSSL